MPETSLQLQSYCGGDGGGGRGAGTPQAPSMVTPLLYTKDSISSFISKKIGSLHSKRLLKHPLFKNSKNLKKSENSENMIKKWMFRKKFVVESDNYFSKWRRDIKSLV